MVRRGRRTSQTPRRALKDTRVVVVMSGGGAKAAAHVGSMKALEELGLKPAHFVGTSMGAVVAACFASGLTYDDVLRRITALTRNDVARPSPSLLLGPLAESLLSEGPLRRTIAQLVPASEFADLRIPLTVTAVDIDSGDLQIFGSGGRDQVPVRDALYASTALPVYYPPGEIGDRRYVDGGLRSVLPIDVAYQLEPDMVVAISVGPSLYADVGKSDAGLSPMLRAHDRSMRIMMAKQTEREIARWSDADVPLIVVEPYHRQQATFDVAGAVRYLEEGYRATMRAFTNADRSWLPKPTSH